MKKYTRLAGLGYEIYAAPTIEETEEEIQNESIESLEAEENSRPEVEKYIQKLYFELFGTNLSPDDMVDVLEALPDDIENDENIFKAELVDVFTELRAYEWADKNKESKYTSDQAMQDAEELSNLDKDSSEEFLDENYNQEDNSDSDSGSDESSGEDFNIEDVDSELESFEPPRRSDNQTDKTVRRSDDINNKRSVIKSIDDTRHISDSSKREAAIVRLINASQAEEDGFDLGFGSDTILPFSGSFNSQGHLSINLGEGSV